MADGLAVLSALIDGFLFQNLGIALNEVVAHAGRDNSLLSAPGAADHHLLLMSSCRFQDNLIPHTVKPKRSHRLAICLSMANILNKITLEYLTQREAICIQATQPGDQLLVISGLLETHRDQIFGRAFEVGHRAGLAPFHFAMASHVAPNWLGSGCAGLHWRL